MGQVAHLAKEALIVHMALDELAQFLSTGGDDGPVFVLALHVGDGTGIGFQGAVQPVQVHRRQLQLAVRDGDFNPGVQRLADGRQARRRVGSASLRRAENADSR